MPSPSDVPTRKYLTWQDLNTYCSSIVHQMISQEYEPSHIVGVGRGGVIPAAIVAYQYSVLTGNSPMIITVYARSYEGEGEMQQGELRVAVNDLELLESLGHKVLVIDDITDSGNTLMALKQVLPDAHTATAVHKETSQFTPNYYGPIDSEGKRNWYVFPWERRQKIG